MENLEAKMKNKLLIGVALFFFISLVSASLGYNDESFGTFQQGDSLNLIQTCQNCTYINITSILSSNSIEAVNDVAMINLTDTTEYNYTFSLTDSLGTYRVNTKADENGIIETASYWFDITPSGRAAPTSGEGMIFIVSLASMFLISLLFFLISFSFRGDPAAMSGSKEAQGNSAARFVFITLSFIVGIITVLYSSVALMETFWGFDRIISSYSTFLYIVLAIFFLMFIFILINLIIRVIESMRTKRGLR